MTTKAATHVFTSTSTDPTMRRELMKLIDQTIAESSTCRFCGDKVELVTVETKHTYDAWLVCTNPACQRRARLS